MYCANMKKRSILIFFLYFPVLNPLEIYVNLTDNVLAKNN